MKKDKNRIILFRAPRSSLVKNKDTTYDLIMQGKKIAKLNEIGGVILNLCDGKHTRQDILEKILVDYEGIDREEAEKYLQEFIGKIQLMHIGGYVYTKDDFPLIVEVE